MTYHNPQETRTACKRGFSLIELVIVIVIIGILAAIAIPRMSSATAGAGNSALSGDLAVLRNAIDLYSSEHGNTFPAVATIDAQLTQYTDVFGATSATKDATHSFGPYLRKTPALPVGPVGYKNATTYIDGSSGTAGASAGAWFYNATNGSISANLDATQLDAAGTAYNTY